MKDGYQCSDESCFSRFLGVTWTEDGSEYINPPSGMGWNKAYTLLKERSKDGMYEAIGSWQRGYEKMKRRQKKYKISINLYWILVEVEPRYRQVFPNEPLNMAQSIGMEKKDPYVWVFTQRKWSWYRREKGFGFRSFTPIWTILKWKNDDFKENYHKALQRDASALQKLMKIYNDISGWSDNQKEPRLWYRIANRILKIKYKGRFEILKNMTI
jgi:hypothetical protein